MWLQSLAHWSLADGNLLSRKRDPGDQPTIAVKTIQTWESAHPKTQNNGRWVPLHLKPSVWALVSHWSMKNLQDAAYLKATPIGQCLWHLQGWDCTVWVSSSCGLGPEHGARGMDSVGWQEGRKRGKGGIGHAQFSLPPWGSGLGAGAGAV